MAPSYDLIVRGGTAATPSGIAAADIAIADGRIAAIGDLARAGAAEIFDASGLHVLPGMIDTQVHFREPGAEHKEDLESGTRAAVLGGVTAVFEMPNTKPLTLTPAALADKLGRAKGRAWCEHAFFIGGAAENADQLAELERLPGCSGVKVFMGSSTGDLLVEDDATLARIIAHGMRRMAVHAEDEPRLKERRGIAEKAAHARAHPVWRDEEVCLKATRRLLGLAAKARRRVHVLHVTTAEEMALLARHKAFATVEVTPSHLILTAPECYERLGTYAQMNPPVREQRHQDALWRAIAEGVVDVVGSDHAPHTRQEKDKPYPGSPSGVPGVQTTVPLLLDAVHRGKLSLERLVDLLCHGPQRIYQIAGKGRLTVGYDGDLTLVDLKRRQRIEHKLMATKSGWTPFDGMTVTGWPIATIIRGHLVMRDGQVLGAALGQPVRFQEYLPA
ncbi:MAG: dihydroorotase [Proteobacteria bacterium]|nr:dihydroorotase [Pseudomonadota bacterium]MBI3498651.1 dihydroorotase [Pseudomonadota bacterium]